MRYKEFEEKIEAWGRKYGYEPLVEKDINNIYVSVIYGISQIIILTTSNSERYVMDLNWSSYIPFPKNAKGDLFQIITEFAATPIEDREDEKLFYVKHKFLGLECDWNYLNKYDDKSYSLDDKFDIGLYKTKFTLEEIEGIKKEFNTNLEDFELVEVEDAEE